MDTDFAGPLKSASNMTLAEALAEMIDRNKNGAELMCKLPRRCYVRLAHLLGELNIAFSEAPTSESEGLQRFELTLRSFDSELKSMLDALASVTDALRAVAVAINAYGTDDASGAWAVADGAVKKVRKMCKKGSHEFIACFEQLAELDQLCERRPPRDDF